MNAEISGIIPGIRLPAYGRGCLPALTALLSGLAACVPSFADDTQQFDHVSFSAKETALIEALSPLPPLPPETTNAYADNPAAARFGQLLFFEKRLSSNGKVSCATCHNPALGFSDQKPLAVGLEKMTRNSPTVLNQAYQRWFFLDGRADSLWAQSLQPLQSKKEMNATVAGLWKVITGDRVLRAACEQVFGPLDKMDITGATGRDEFLSRLGKSFEAYQRLLISRDSLFDRFVARGLKEKSSPINESAQRGLKLFIGRGQCILCHSGPVFSDGEFHNIGLPASSAEAQRDTGRFKGIRDVKADRFNGLGKFSDDRSPETNAKLRFVIQKMSNLGEFKTPSLRDVVRTAPYMHDGRFATLREVLDYYSELPGEPTLGHREETLTPLKLTGREKDDLVAFLKTLSGAPLDPRLVSVAEISRSVHRER